MDLLTKNVIVKWINNLNNQEFIRDYGKSFNPLESDQLEDIFSLYRIALLIFPNQISIVTDENNMQMVLCEFFLNSFSAFLVSPTSTESIRITIHDALESLSPSTQSFSISIVWGWLIILWLLSFNSTLQFDSTISIEILSNLLHHSIGYLLDYDLESNGITTKCIQNQLSEFLCCHNSRKSHNIICSEIHNELLSTLSVKSFDDLNNSNLYLTNYDKKIENIILENKEFFCKVNVLEEKLQKSLTENEQLLATIKHQRDTIQLVSRKFSENLNTEIDTTCETFLLKKEIESHIKMKEMMNNKIQHLEEKLLLAHSKDISKNNYVNPYFKKISDSFVQEIKQLQNKNQNQLSVIRSLENDIENQTRIINSFETQIESFQNQADQYTHVQADNIQIQQELKAERESNKNQYQMLLDLQKKIAEQESQLNELSSIKVNELIVQNENMNSNGLIENNIRDELSRLSKENNDMKEKILKLEEFESYQSTVECLKEQLAESSYNFSKSKTTIKQKELELQQKDEHINELKKKIQNYQSSYQSQIHQEKLNTNLETQIEFIENNLKITQDNYNNLKVLYDNTLDKLTQSLNQRDHLETEISVLNGEKNSLNIQNNANISYIKDLENKVNKNLLPEITNLKKEINSLRNSSNILQEEIDLKNQIIEDKDSILSSMNLQVVQFQTIVSDSQDKNTQFVNQVSELQNRYNQLEDSLAKSYMITNDYKSQVCQLKKSLKISENDIISLNDTQNKLKKKIDVLITEKNIRSDEKQRLESELVFYRSEFERLDTLSKSSFIGCSGNNRENMVKACLDDLLRQIDLAKMELTNLDKTIEERIESIQVVNRNNEEFQIVDIVDHFEREKLRVDAELREVTLRLSEAETSYQLIVKDYQSLNKSYSKVSKELMDLRNNSSNKGSLSKDIGVITYPTDNLNYSDLDKSLTEPKLNLKIMPKLNCFNYSTYIQPDILQPEILSKKTIILSKVSFLLFNMNPIIGNVYLQESLSKSPITLRKNLTLESQIIDHKISESHGPQFIDFTITNKVDKDNQIWDPAESLEPNCNSNNNLDAKGWLAKKYGHSRFSNFIDSLATPSDDDYSNQIHLQDHKRNKVCLNDGGLNNKNVRINDDKKLISFCTRRELKTSQSCYSNDSDYVTIKYRPVIPISHSYEEIDFETDKEMRSETDKEMRSKIDKEMRSEIDKEMRSETDKEMRSETDKEMRSEIDKEMRSEIDKEMRSETDKEMRSEIDKEMRSETDKEMRSKTDKEMRSEIDKEMRSETDKEMRSETDKEMRSETDKEMRFETDKEMRSETDKEMRSETDKEMRFETDKEVDLDFIQEMQHIINGEIINDIIKKSNSEINSDNGACELFITSKFQENESCFIKHQSIINYKRRSSISAFNETACAQNISNCSFDSIDYGPKYEESVLSSEYLMNSNDGKSQYCANIVENEIIEDSYKRSIQTSIEDPSFVLNPVDHCIGDLCNHRQSDVAVEYDNNTLLMKPVNSVILDKVNSIVVESVTSNDNFDVNSFNTLSYCYNQDVGNDMDNPISESIYSATNSTIEKDSYYFTNNKNYEDKKCLSMDSNPHYKIPENEHHSFGDLMDSMQNISFKMDSELPIYLDQYLNDDQTLNNRNLETLTFNEIKPIMDDQISMKCYSSSTEKTITDDGVTVEDVEYRQSMQSLLISSNTRSQVDEGFGDFFNSQNRISLILPENISKNSVSTSDSKADLYLRKSNSIFVQSEYANNEIVTNTDLLHPTHESNFNSLENECIQHDFSNTISSDLNKKHNASESFCTNDQKYPSFFVKENIRLSENKDDDFPSFQINQSPRTGDRTTCRDLDNSLGKPKSLYDSLLINKFIPNENSNESMDISKMECGPSNLPSETDILYKFKKPHGRKSSYAQHYLRNNDAVSTDCEKLTKDVKSSNDILDRSFSTIYLSNTLESVENNSVHELPVDLPSELTNEMNQTNASINWNCPRYSYSSQNSNVRNSALVIRGNDNIDPTGCHTKYVANSKSKPKSKNLISCTTSSSESFDNLRKSTSLKSNNTIPNTLSVKQESTRRSSGATYSRQKSAVNTLALGKLNSSNDSFIKKKEVNTNTSLFISNTNLEKKKSIEYLNKDKFVVAPSSNSIVIGNTQNNVESKMPRDKSILKKIACKRLIPTSKMSIKRNNTISADNKIHRDTKQSSSSYCEFFT